MSKFDEKHNKLSEQERLKIDYEIQAKRKDSEQNLESWGCAFIVAFLFLFFV